MYIFELRVNNKEEIKKSVLKIIIYALFGAIRRSLIIRLFKLPNYCKILSLVSVLIELANNFYTLGKMMCIKNKNGKRA